MGVFTWFDSILSFDSAGSSAVKCEQDVNRKKKFVVANVTFGYVRSQSTDSMNTDNRGWDVTHHSAAHLFVPYHTIHV